MASKHLWFVATCMIIGFTRESLAHEGFFMGNGNMHKWGDPTHGLMGPPRNVQPPIYQFQNRLPSGFQVSDAEWICENPKTKDMMIIATEKGPAVPRGNGQSVSIHPPMQPSANFQPSYPQNQNRPYDYPRPKPPVINQPIYPQWNQAPTLGYLTPSSFENNENYQPTEPNINSNNPVTQRLNDPVSSAEMNSRPDFTTANLMLVTTQKPIQGQSNIGGDVDDDDDGPIQIVMGKK